MSVEKKYTDKMQDSFQERLRVRVEKMDPLLNFRDWYAGNIGYYYSTGLNFGKLFKAPNASPLVDEFLEVMDNAGTEDKHDCALVFSRPGDVIYVMVDPAVYFLAHVTPMLLIRFQKLGEMVIVKLEDFLEAQP